MEESKWIRYRKRAGELKAIAEKVTDEADRQALITIANEYEQTAKIAEARAKRDDR